VLYSLLRKILFCLNPEATHELSLNLLYYLEKINATALLPAPISNPKTVWGLNFVNPVGLAAGLDKNGDYIDALATLGFGFIEVGSITPKPQPGNPKPRLFRLEDEAAIINRMGFNNKGVDYLVERLKKMKYKGILGVNIGKNRDTLLNNALDDYLFVMKRVLPYASYITINISSPNTEGLRDLQHGEYLRTLLRELKKEQALYKQKYVPLLVKISPDLTPDEISDMAEIFLQEKIDGVIATNTTTSRQGVENSSLGKEAGGLSGHPLFLQSTKIMEQFNKQFENKIPLIGCGGISNAEDAKIKMQAGASLLQVYTGLIYQGPALVRELARL
jgi:dihydroorotate dehydrogenase